MNTSSRPSSSRQARLIQLRFVIQLSFAILRSNLKLITVGLMSPFGKLDSNLSRIRNPQLLRISGTLTAVLLIVGTAIGQEDPIQHMFENGIAMSYEVTGVPEKPRRTEFAATPFLRVLSESDVANELLREAKNSNRVKRILADYRQATEELHQSFRYEIVDNEIPAEMITAWNELLSDSETELERQLSVSQQRRLRELFFWKQIKTWGLPALLYGSELGKELGITDKQKSEMKLFTDVVRFTIQDQISEFERERMKEFAEVLDSTQQAQFWEYFPAEKIDSLPPLKLSRIKQSLRHSKDWVPSQQRSGYVSDPIRDSELPAYFSVSGYRGDAIDLLTKGSTSELRLTAEQVNDIEKNRKALNVEFDLLKTDYPKWNDRSSSQRKEFISDYRDAKQKRDREIIDEILDDEQRKRLLTIHYELLKRKCGLVCVLADSSLSERLKLTSDQRDEIFRIAREQSSQIKELELEIHDAVLDKMIDFLEPNQQVTIKRILGERPTMGLRKPIHELANQMNFIRASKLGPVSNPQSDK